MPSMGTIVTAKVTAGRKRDADGDHIGKCNANLILDTREYEIEGQFPDGATDIFTAKNIIAESLYAQVDDEGNSYAILHERITDHKRDGTTVIKDDGFIATQGGERNLGRLQEDGTCLSAGKMAPHRGLH